MIVNRRLTQNTMLALTITGGLLAIPVLALVLSSGLVVGKDAETAPNPRLAEASSLEVHPTEPSDRAPAPVQAAYSAHRAPQAIENQLGPAFADMPKANSGSTEAMETTALTAATAAVGPAPTFSASRRPAPPSAPRSSASAAFAVAVPRALPPGGDG